MTVRVQHLRARGLYRRRRVDVELRACMARDANCTDCPLCCATGLPMMTELVRVTEAYAGGCRCGRPHVKVWLLTIRSALGVVVAAACCCAAVVATPTEKVIYSFGGAPLGELPEASVILDAQGNLYGTTTRGGTGTQCSSSCGTVFELEPQSSGGWKETDLHSFDLIDGAYPDTPLLLDPSGNFFGVTQVGGGLGLAYELSPGSNDAWHFQVLHRFRGNHDGQQPRGALIRDGSGTLYGTTVGGGSGGSGGNGTAFELSPSANGGWQEIIVNRFRATAHGIAPQAPLVFDPAGTLYGTASYGGNQACANGCGTAFELVPTENGGRQLVVLHAFKGSDGSLPDAGLVPDMKGNFFGSTDEGALTGCFGGCGVIFELSANKAHGGFTFTVLHKFDVSDGGGPEGAMMFDGAGNLYGSTVVGGNVAACPQQRGCGVVFELSPAPYGQWVYSVLHIFQNGADGALPTGVTIDPAGNLYGTTITGGAYSLGTVFEVTP